MKPLHFTCTVAAVKHFEFRKFIDLIKKIMDIKWPGYSLHYFLAFQIVIVFTFLVGYRLDEFLEK